MLHTKIRAFARIPASSVFILKDTTTMINEYALQLPLNVGHN